MKPYVFFLMFVLCFSLASATVDKINYPSNHDVITYSNNILLNVSSTASTGCVLYYNTSLGTVHRNQSVSCNGVTFVDLPSVEGEYTLFVQDDVGSIATSNITVDKPSGIFVTFIIALSISSLLSILFFLFYNIAKVVTLDTSIYDVGISYVSFFALMFAIQLHEEFINIPFFNDWLGLLIGVSAFTSMVLPTISLVITMMFKTLQKAEPPNKEEIFGRRFVNG